MLVLPGLDLDLLPARAYSARDPAALHSLGLALERQTGVHAIGSDRRRDFDTWPGTLAWTPPGIGVFSESPGGGEYLVLRWQEKEGSGSGQRREWRGHRQASAENEHLLGCLFLAARLSLLATRRLPMADRIEKTIELKATPARVWRALTDHREFGAWFRVALDGPFKVGEDSTGHIAYPGYEHLRWHAVVKVMEPERRFAFTWHPYAIDPEYDYSAETPTLVEFTLEPAGAGTRLTIVESGFDKLPAHRRDQAFRSNGEGWSIQCENIRHHVDDAAA